ncbi:hypothetical protein [Brevibacillus porteri]|uniref:Helicase n=1 Tax=Brevibacillus porteri TaxID=2126350 RepID=A0ABX5FIQ7_9BACL|nr:hypothetical protein [Brevibacillus porteri]MED1797906.1 hypothetical protein [Brevibacillus porteri]MED2130992.1 hypothetical protein [Brevibacillus porteri]MED2746949.1 hypothetical protein [Brevibacillus porteri]MED2812951.1 hypothetical protein [Brevibacillus porteri]MED2892111.1 hypothetical protein [Brevibacillus porteri]
MITIKALPPSRGPSLLPRASSQGFAQSIMQKYRHGEGRDPGYLALIHRDFSPSIGGQENHFHQTFIHVRMQVQVDSYLGLNREMLPNGQAGFPWPKERAVITQASGSGRKVQPATLIHELFRKWESSKLIEKVYLPRIMVVSNGRDRYRWSSYVQSSVQRASSLEKWLPLGRFKEQIDPVDITSPLWKAIVSDSKETVRERFRTPETSYGSPEFLVHGDPGGRKSMQIARERIWLESATRIDAISNSRVRATRSETGRFERFGVRNFWQLIGRGMEPEIGTWSFPVLLKRAEGRAASSFFDRAVWTERAGIDGKDITRRIVRESESTRWSVASQQTELWRRWWENLSLWQKSRATWLPRTMTVHPRLRVLQPTGFLKSRQHPQAKSAWMLETLSPLERKIFQSNELSKMFSSVLPSILHRADAGRTKQQAVRERFKQLFHLAQQFSRAESERRQAVLVSRQRLKQIESRREEQSSALAHLLRHLISRERQATVLASRVEQEQPSSITFHPSQLLLPFESIGTRNQQTYAFLQQLIFQEARLNEIVREQSIRLRSSHEQTHPGKTNMIPVVSHASYQQLDVLQHEWWTGLSLRLLHPLQGQLFPLRMTRITDSSQTVPLLSQPIVRKSIAAYWIQSFQSANALVFFEKRGWLNQPWIKEYLETHNEIERGLAGIASAARFAWNRFVPVFHVNRQLWQTLQDQIVSSTHQETNRKSVMAWVHLQQRVAKQLSAREFLATRTHAPRHLPYEPRNQSPYPVGISQPFFQSPIHFPGNKHVYQLPYETVRQLLSFQGRKNKRADVAFFKNQEKFSLPGRKATISMVHEHEHRPIRHTFSLKNEQSTSRAFLHTHRHDRAAVSLRLNGFGSAMLRVTEWIGLERTEHQRLYNTSAKSFSIREDVSDRNSLRRIAAGWSAELGLTILLQKSAKLAAMREFSKVGKISTSGKAPPSSEKQSNDHPRSRQGESNPIRESRPSRESYHSRFLHETASLWTSSVALHARLYLQVMEQIKKAIQTDFRTEAYIQNHHSLSTVLNRHDTQMVVQKQWRPLPSLMHGQSVRVPDSFMHESGSIRATELLPRKGRVNSWETLSRHSRFQQTNHEQILTVNQNGQMVKRLTHSESQKIEIQDARLTPLQRAGIFNLTSTTPMAAEKVEHAKENTSLALLPKPMLAMAKQPPLLQALQQAQRAPGESEQRSLSENATHTHRQSLRTADSYASPAATVQSPPSMEFLRKNIQPQETAVQQTTTLPLQRQVDLDVQERAGNQTSLSPQEVDRLMDKMMKELDKRLIQERQRRGL